MKINRSIIPIFTYTNAEKDKLIILKENKHKSGIYRWNNLITGKSYIGSSTSLTNRFFSYYSIEYLKMKVTKIKSIIYNSILKYGHSNFSLDILEYCEVNKLLEREQYYMDYLKPEYNILKIAGSRLYAKQTKETKILISKKLSGRILSKESILKLKESIKNRKGKETSFFGKSHSNKTIALIASKKSIPIKILNINTGIEKIFTSNISGAKFLNIGISTLRRYKKLGKPFIKEKESYLISNKKVRVA